MNLTKFIIAFSMILLATGLIGEKIAYGSPYDYDPEILEDEVLICIADLTTIETNDNNCHVFAAEDIDWYQELSEYNYGIFGSYDDSFEVEIKH